MGDLEETLSQSCRNYPGGIKSLAADLSINPGTLYNKCKSEHAESFSKYTGSTENDAKQPGLQHS